MLHFFDSYIITAWSRRHYNHMQGRLLSVWQNLRQKRLEKLKYRSFLYSLYNSWKVDPFLGRKDPVHITI